MHTSLLMSIFWIIPTKHYEQTNTAKYYSISFWFGSVLGQLKESLEPNRLFLSQKYMYSLDYT